MRGLLGSVMAREGSSMSSTLAGFFLIVVATAPGIRRPPTRPDGERWEGGGREKREEEEEKRGESRREAEKRGERDLPLEEEYLASTS